MKTSTPSTASGKKSRALLWTLLLGLAVVLVAKKFDYFGRSEELQESDVRASLAGYIAKGNFPREILLQTNGDTAKKKAFVEYTIDPALQNRAETLLSRYTPDFGAIVVMDATTGEILALAQSSTKEHTLGNLALSTAFPAASVYKIITAAAAIDEGKAYTETVIPYNGRNHTLYKKNLLHTDENRWTRHVTLREAFGRSINTVFGKLGIFNVGSNDLEKYADRFFFNKKIPSDLDIEVSSTAIQGDDQYELAETASGFTTTNTLSPVHGALLAAAVVNDGSLIEPHIVKRVMDGFNRPQYVAKNKTLGSVISPYSAEQMKLLMRETVTKGTSRRFFRPLIQNEELSQASFGGKTGSLTGRDPHGKCDWFVGYGFDQDRKIAVSILTVHQKYWTVKSAFLAKSLLEQIFLDTRSGKEQYARTSSSR